MEISGGMRHLLAVTGMEESLAKKESSKKKAGWQRLPLAPAPSSSISRQEMVKLNSVPSFRLKITAHSSEGVPATKQTARKETQDPEAKGWTRKGNVTLV